MNKYRIDIHWSENDGAFVATIPEFPSIAVLADSRENVLAEAEQVLEGVVEQYIEDGLDLPVRKEEKNDYDYSGQIRLRMPKSLHADCARLAERESISLNQLLCLSIESYITSRSTASAIFGAIVSLAESASTADRHQGLGKETFRLQGQTDGVDLVTS